MIRRIIKEITNDISNSYYWTKRKFKQWLIGKLGGKIYYIQGEAPKTVSEDLLKGVSAEIVVNISPFNTGNIIEVKGNTYKVIGYSLKVIKHD